MKSTTVYLVELTESVRETAMVAAREAFPRTQLQLVPVRTVAEALRLPGQGRQMLIVGDATEGDLGIAAQATDAGELPRWAVVHFGQPASDVVETVSPEGCTPRSLARILRASMLHHELLRENLQLRGDLKTVARRLNHDIRTPLGCINTVCSLLQEAGAGGTRSPQDAVTTIRGATAEIDVLLDQVGFVLKASSEPLPTVAVPMGPVIDAALRRLADQEPRGIKIEQPAHWPEARAVESWLGFVWTNLLQQAVRHVGRARSLQLGWDPRGSDVRFWVATDAAVPVPLQASLLKPFHLLHQQAAGALELSLVDRLVSLQGGRCGYETTPDRRGLFYFTLPGAPPAPAPAAGSRTGVAGNRGS